MDYESYNDDRYKKGFWNINRSKHKFFSNYVKLKIFKKWSRRKNKGTILDLGGGVGNWAYHFLGDFEKVVVLDISNEALSKIPEKEIVKIHGSVLNIPLKSKAVDVVLMADVFEHIYVHELDIMMSEVKRILKDDGRIIIFTSQYGYGIDLLSKRFRYTRRKIIEEEYLEGHGHLNRLKFSEMKRLIKKQGLVIEDYYHYSIIFQLLTDFLKNSLAKIIDKLRKEKSEREGQVIKDKLKNIERGLLFSISKFLSKISYLDIIIFGKICPGSTIFLKLKK
jgi:cyclopropane fatty-acyl-phospholipid synthase-like methyltransferase